MTRDGFALLILGLACAIAPVQAQAPPSAAEIAEYRGLHAAAARGDAAEIARRRSGGADANARDGRGRTALHIAVFRSHGDAARALVRGGADPRAMENQRYDIITIAAVANDLPMLRLALESGADPRAVTSPYDGTALIAAAHLGHDGVVRELIRAGAPVDHVNNLGWTALIEAVILGDGGPRHLACVEALIAARANPTIADRGGVTPLAHARQRGYSAMIAMLEKAGAR